MTESETEFTKIFLKFLLKIITKIPVFLFQLTAQFEWGTLIDIGLYLDLCSYKKFSMQGLVVFWTGQVLGARSFTVCMLWFEIAVTEWADNYYLNYLDFKSTFGNCYTLIVLKSSLEKKCGFCIVFNQIVCGLNNP